MSKQVLTDFVGFLDISPSIVSEAKSNNNNDIYISGKLQAADEKNRNGRKYPRSILEREKDKFEKKIEAKTNGGELDHPDSSVVNLKNISHKITELWWQGNDLMGKVKIINTPAGKIAQELIADDIKLGISSRGLGSTKNIDGIEEVQENFELLTWDLVSNPSTYGAYMKLSEGYNGQTSQIYYNLNNIINNILDITN